jgi:hypothetical protein
MQKCSFRSVAITKVDKQASRGKDVEKGLNTTWRTPRSYLFKYAGPSIFVLDKNVF